MADADLECRERADRLRNALKRLARRQHEVLQLVFYHELTVEDAQRTALESAVTQAQAKFTSAQWKLSGIPPSTIVGA